MLLHCFPVPAQALRVKSFLLEPRGLGGLLGLSRGLSMVPGVK
jgi:hypothetical protein